MHWVESVIIFAAVSKEGRRVVGPKVLVATHQRCDPMLQGQWRLTVPPIVTGCSSGTKLVNSKCTGATEWGKTV